MSVWIALLLTALALLVGLVIGAALAVYRYRDAPPSSTATAYPSNAEVLSSVAEQAPYAFVVLNRFHSVILYNRRATDLGLVEDGRLISRVWEAVEASFGDGRPSSFNLPPQAVAGRRRIPSVSGHCELLGDHGERYVVVFADDDSEQRRMEAARRDFVANVSHELKTPVGAMAVLAEALVESSDDPDAVEYFGDRVAQEAHRLGAMVTELIALSRLQGAERIRDPQPVSVDEVVDEAVKRSESLAEAESITINTDAPSGYELLGDRTLLVTALSNLISNAINYSPERTPVSLSRASDGENVYLRVTDRGIGIAPEHQGRVFERFFRVDRARSRSTGGTGLGLAIVKHVVQNHDGTVRLWSRPGMGSTFTLQLPVLRDAAPPQGPTITTGAAEDPASAGIDLLSEREDKAS